MKYKPYNQLMAEHKQSTCTKCGYSWDARQESGRHACPQGIVNKLYQICQEDQACLEITLATIELSLSLGKDFIASGGEPVMKMIKDQLAKHKE